MRVQHPSLSTTGRWPFVVLLTAVTFWFAGLPASAQTGLGLALSLDGVDDYVSVAPGSALDLTSGTIELWMNPRSLAGNACLLASGGPTSAQTRYRIHLSTNALGLWNGSSYQTVPFAGATGQWCHVAVVLSPTNAQFFVNGLPIGTTTNGINLDVTGAPFALGAAYDNSGILSNYFAGFLNEVRVWNVTRSQADITNHMFQPVSAAEPGLVACYRFDEASGITAYDATTNHQNGILVNRPVRVPFRWVPVITLNTPDSYTNECHVTFVDPGANVSASPLALAACSSHSLALRGDGTVVGWGYNSYGQIAIPASATNAVAIVAGMEHNLALKGDGTVVGWGRNYEGQTTIPANATNVVALAAGGVHSLALKGDGTVIGWGSNNSGQTNIPTSATNVVALAAGSAHSLALKGDGTVVGWGYNNYGQTTIPASATNVVALAAGAYHSLALKGDGTVVGWGFNHRGQTTIPDSATNVVQIAAGIYHSLALKGDGTVVGWGENYYGETNIPISVTNVVAIVAGIHHNLALKGDGTVVGWGSNEYGQTNIPASAYQLNLPVSVSGMADTNPPGVYILTYSATNALGAVGTAARTVVVTDTRSPVLALLGANPLPHTLGIPFTDPGATATDLCAGDLAGSIVITNTVNSSLPGSYTNTYTVTDAFGNTAQITRTILVGGPLPTTLPASGLLNDVATLNGTVNPNGMDTTAWFEWGSAIGQDWNRYANTTPPVAVGGSTVPVPMSAGLISLTPGVTYRYRVVASNSVGVTRGAAQTFWSPAVNLDSRDPLTNECHMPFVDPTTVNAFPVAIAAGYYHSLALKTDGTVVGWGYNGSGQTAIPAGATNVVALAASDDHSLALKGDGTVVGWGAGGPGTSGYPNYGQTTVPASATNVVALATGSSHSLALRRDGTVVGWGAGGPGQLGELDQGQTTIPASAINVVAIAAGSLHSLALKGDGTVVGWGAGGPGTSGYPNYGQTTVPASATNVVAIAAGGLRSLALKADGTVVGWGYNYSGEANIPVSATNVVVIAAGGSHSLALKGDGTVVGWGYNYSGQTTIPPSATNVVALATGSSHSLALRRDGTVVGWGAGGPGQSGELDQGQTTIPAGLNNLNLALSVSGTVDTNAPGVYILTYSVTNALGAVGTATRTVVVVDTQPPVLTLMGDNPLMVALGVPFADPGATATDLCAGGRTGSIYVWGNVNTSMPGSYPLVYIVTDTSGNLAVTNRTVVVVTRPLLTGISQGSGRSFQFRFTNTPGARFTVLAATNAALPMSNWTAIGTAVETPVGVFQFTDTTATNYPVRFYQLMCP